MRHAYIHDESDNQGPHVLRCEACIRADAYALDGGIDGVEWEDDDDWRCATCGESPQDAVSIAARLPDGQTLRDEQHIGEYAGCTLTRAQAENAIEHLAADRPDGHEDVAYIIEAA